MPLNTLQIGDVILVTGVDDETVDLETSQREYLEARQSVDIEKLIFTLNTDFEDEFSKIKDDMELSVPHQRKQQNHFQSLNPFLQDTIRRERLKDLFRKKPQISGTTRQPFKRRHF